MRYLQISPSLIKVSLRKMELHYSVIGFWWPAMQQEMNWSRSLSFYQTICMHTTFLFIPFGGSGLWIWFNLISSYLIYIEIFKEVIVFSLRVVKLGNILTFSIQFMCSFFYSNEKEDKVLLKIVLSRLCWGQCYLHNLVLGASPYFTFVEIIFAIFFNFTVESFVIHFQNHFKISIMKFCQSESLIEMIMRKMYHSNQDLAILANFEIFQIS